MKIWTANIFGITAVALFVLSYQCKSRKGLILTNGSSRILYVLQYILLGAFEGAVLDIVALLVTLVAQNKDREKLRKYTKALFVVTNLFVIATGMLLYQNIFSLLPIAGVLFETGALWLNKEKQIRAVSVLGAPCWLIYNLVFRAYGSAFGNVLTILSIVLAMIRYDIRKKEP